MDQRTCSVAGCEKPVKRAGFCYGHYMKNWRYGTPEPEHSPNHHPLEGMVFGELTVLRREGHYWICSCACGASTRALSGDLNRGTLLSCGNRAIHHRRSDADYGAAHGRVKRDRGKAADHSCVDCSGPARHWSYDHSDPDELVSESPRTKGVAYSLDPNHYSPRCVPCHKRFDLNRINAASRW